MYKITTLDNGLKIITDRMVDAHSLAVGLWIKTGGRYESKERHGISHFMEHMLFKGTKNRSCQQLKRAIEEKGGHFNAFTAEEFVCYYVKILSKHLKLASDILADMILNPLISPEDIEKERKVIFEEIRMHLDLPMQYVYELLDELLWPGHPLGMPLTGTYDTVRTINRSDLLGHKELFHIPNNIIAVCCGNIEHDGFVEVMDKFFKKTKPKKRTSLEKVNSVHSRGQTIFFHKDTEQTHICLGTIGLSRLHPKRFALALLSIILGGNMSSRLFNEIREKRSLAYEIGTSVKSYCDTGAFLVHAGIENRKVKEAIAVIVKELAKIKKFPVAIKELAMAKEYCRSGLLMMLEDTMSNMLFLGEQQASIDKLYTKEDILKEIDKVDIDMIRDVAQMLFGDGKLKLAVIGQQGEEDKEAIEDIL